MKLAIALVGLAVIASAGLVAVDQALVESGSEFEVQGEEFEPQTGTYVAVNVTGSDIRYSPESEIVVKNSSGTVVPPTAYDWNASDGSILTVQGGELQGEPNATVSYDVYEPNPAQEQLGEASGSVFGASSIVLFVLVAGLVYRSMRVLI